MVAKRVEWKNAKKENKNYFMELRKEITTNLASRLVS